MTDSAPSFVVANRTVERLPGNPALRGKQNNTMFVRTTWRLMLVAVAAAVTTVDAGTGLLCPALTANSSTCSSDRTSHIATRPSPTVTREKCSRGCVAAGYIDPAVGYCTNGCSVYYPFAGSGEHFSLPKRLSPPRGPPPATATSHDFFGNRSRSVQEFLQPRLWKRAPTRRRGVCIGV